MNKPKMMKVRVVPIPGHNAAVVKYGTSSRYHTEADGVFEVPVNSYYFRAINRKELELVTESKRSKAAKDDNQ